MARPFKHRRAYTVAQRDLVITILQLIRGFSNTEAASECGLTPSTVSKWRTRRTKVPSMSSALKVAAAMGCTLKIVEAEGDRAERQREKAEQRAALH